MRLGRLPRSPLTRLVLLTMVLAVLLAGWVAVRAAQAQQELSTARQELGQARTALLNRQAAKAEQAVARAGRSTARARALTGDPLWRLVAAVPVAGRSLKAAAGLARAADGLARSVLPPGLDAARALSPDRLRRPDGSIDVALVQAAGRPVAASSAALSSVRAQLSRLPQQRVLPVLEEARAQLERETEDLAALVTGAEQALDVAPALLGQDRPRSYFVLVQQTSEARGTGGLPGGFAVLRADRGRIAVLRSGSNGELVNGPIPLPAGVPAGYARRYAANGAFSLWQNVNLSPDLPVVARVVAARWRAQGGQPVDGVIAVDASGLQSLLAGTPPVRVGPDRQVAPDQLERYLGLEQYVGSRPIDQLARKDDLAAVAREAVDRITRGGVNEELLRGLIRAVRSGHLRLATDDPALRSRLRKAEVDGALPSGPAPLAYPVIVNAAGSKLDYFLDRSVVYAAGPCRGSSRASSIAVELRNRAPATGLPPYVTIRSVGGRTVDSTTNEVLLAVYGTSGARLQVATLDGSPVPVGPQGVLVTREAGLPVWQVQLSLPREQPRRLVLQLVEPAGPGLPRVPEQPLARPLRREVRVAAC